MAMIWAAVLWLQPSSAQRPITKIHESVCPTGTTRLESLPLSKLFLSCCSSASVLFILFYLFVCLFICDKVFVAQAGLTCLQYISLSDLKFMPEPPRARTEVRVPPPQGPGSFAFLCDCSFSSQSLKTLSLALVFLPVLHFSFLHLQFSFCF